LVDFFRFLLFVVIFSTPTIYAIWPILRHINVSDLFYGKITIGQILLLVSGQAILIGIVSQLDSNKAAASSAACGIAYAVWFFLICRSMDKNGSFGVFTYILFALFLGCCVPIGLLFSISLHLDEVFEGKATRFGIFGVVLWTLLWLTMRRVSKRHEKFSHQNRNLSGTT
jgi:hypothetical protein